MRAPKGKILFDPDPVPDKVKVGGIELHLPYGTMHGEKLHMDWPITGTVIADCEFTQDADGDPLHLKIQKGDRILFHFNVCSPSRDNGRPKYEGVSWCYPTDVFMYWREDVAYPVGEYIFTEKATKKEVVTPSGIIIPGADTETPAGMSTGNHVLSGTGVLRIAPPMPQSLKGSGWEDVQIGDTLHFPESSQIEIRLDGNTSRETDGDIAYRQKMSQTWAFSRDGQMTMLCDYVLIRENPEDRGVIIQPFFEGRDRFKRGEVIKAGPSALVSAGDVVAYNDIMGWRMTVDGETYTVVKADDEGVMYVCC